MSGPIERQGAFHAVLEPRDIAEELDTGPTVRYRSMVQRVNPITLLEEAEFLSRADARAALGIGDDALAVLLQLGSCNNLDILTLIDTALDSFGQKPEVEVRLAEWVIAEDSLDLFPGVPKLRDYPIARYFKAFDFALSAVGYNSFHEIIAASLPMIFVPNTHPSMDNQLARASYASERGASFMLLPDEPERMAGLISRMMDPAQRDAMRQACGALSLSNGAGEAACLVMNLTRSVA